MPSKKIDYNAQMYAVILGRVADAGYMLQLLSPIDFEASLIVRQDIPAEPDADAGERIGEAGDRRC